MFMSEAPSVMPVAVITGCGSVGRGLIRLPLLSNVSVPVAGVTVVASARRDAC